MTDDILVKYLLGEASQEEQAAVQGWVDSNADNKRYFENFKLIWEQSEQLAVTSTIDEHAAWERFQQRIAQKEAAPKVIPFAPRRQFGFVRAAAAILLLVCCGWAGYMFVNNGSSSMLALESGDEVLMQTLPDGTTVTLNKHSKLSYPKNFKGDTRTVALNGEAFFNVTPDKSKPFIINANDVNVRVVGTSFNVKSSDEKTEVVVATGIVAVTKDNRGVKLHPKQKATVLKGAAPVMSMNDDAPYNYYSSDEVEFNNTPLRRVVDILNEIYKSKIVIENKRLETEPITTKFRKSQTVEEILRDGVIDTHNIKMTISGDRIILN